MVRRDRNGNGLPQAAFRARRVKVRNASRRKSSSTWWLKRQLNDPYVLASQTEGYRSRAAYKLLELNDRFGFLHQGKKVLELGSAPGAWTQVNVAKVGTGNVVAVDLKEMEVVPGAKFIQFDVLKGEDLEKMDVVLHGGVDVVESDMAAPSTGHAGTDHLRTMALCEAAFEVAIRYLNPGGFFVAKVIQGGSEKSLLRRLQTSFRTVKHAKPPASRASSAELYVVARGFYH